MANWGLFLDLDGTLCDSIGGLIQAYHSFLKHYDAIGSEEEFISINGPPLTNVVEILKHNHGLQDNHQTLYNSYLQLALQAHQAAPPAQGAQEILHRAQQNNWHIVLVTSTPHGQAQNWLEQHSLHSYFSAIIGGDDVQNGKPDPAPYQAALRAINAQAERSIAVEDSHQGVLSALGARIPTFMIAQTFPLEMRKQKNFRGILDEFKDIENHLSENSR